VKKGNEGGKGGRESTFMNMTMGTLMPTVRAREGGREGRREGGRKGWVGRERILFSLTCFLQSCILLTFSP
jgi:hypothetical protein